MKYDVIIIGSGTAGQTAAFPLAKAGKKVAVIDDRLPGGTCAIRGCTAKKFFVSNREALDSVRNLQGTGLEKIPEAVWKQTLSLKTSFTDQVPDKTKHIFKKAGIDFYEGTAYFTSKQTISLKKSDHPKASDSSKNPEIHDFTFESLIISSGSDPRIPDIPGIEYAIDSEDFLSLPELPVRFLTIGAGYIAFEFAHIISSYGGTVTMLDRNPLPLSIFDPDLVNDLTASTRKRGINLVPERSAVSIEKISSGLAVTDSNGDIYEADAVLNSSGRIPRTGELDCAAGGVTLKNRGVAVDEFARSISNPNVYAVGDAAAGYPMLAPVADKMALIASQSILNRGSKNNNSPKMSKRVIPSTVFTNPPLSSVGMSEKEAVKLYRDDLIINSRDFSGSISNKQTGAKFSRYKILIQKSTGLIVGAHLLGRSSYEVINIFALAIEADIPVSVLASIPWAYPTSSSEIKYMI